MASNSFGSLFRITTWGESHGKAIGVVIDGCPAGLELSLEDIHRELARRAPGRSAYTSPRKEEDCAEIFSGVFEGKTTGAPISILIYNGDADSTKYEPIKHLLRPGHANFTYLEKYGIFDYRGGGRASARETACRVAAGAVAKKLLAHEGVEIRAFIENEDALKEEIAAAQQAGDSIGGVVSFEVCNLPSSLGDPVYEKLEANLAKALMSLPATKGFEIGQGFEAALQRGSASNDLYALQDGKIVTTTNRAGGTLAGISTGMPLTGRVAFKAASSIKIPQATLNLAGEPEKLELPEGSRHDPCVALRAIPVVEAMIALVLADSLLMNRCAKL